MNSVYKVPPIRRQGEILTLVQIYWHSKISYGQPEVFSPSLSLLFSSCLFSSRCFLALQALAPRAYGKSGVYM